MADIIQDVILRVSSDAEDLRKGIAKVDDKVKDTKKQASGLQNAFKSLLPAIGVSAVVAGLTKIAKASIDAAAKAEGIEQAFKRFGDSGLLDELRTKTKNLVSDVELQKQAVKFEQFNLPLEDLGNLLAFATQRAQDTGESVDFLTNSIVTGLARKSLPILDNLGLNTKEIASEAEKAGNFFKGVGTIVSREMAKAAGATETYSQRVQKLDATIDNTQVNLGKLLLPVVSEVTNGFAKLAETAADFLEVPLSDKIRQEKIELNALVQSIVSTNENEDLRLSLINDLNRQYPQFIQNIGDEKVSNDQLLETLKLVNKEYDLKIQKVALEELIGENTKKAASAFKQLRDATKNAGLALQEFNTIDNQQIKEIVANEDGLLTLTEQYKKIEEIQKQIGAGKKESQLSLSEIKLYNALESNLANVSKELRQFTDAQDLLNSLSKEGLDIQSEYNKFIEDNPLLKGNALGKTIVAGVEEELNNLEGIDKLFADYLAEVYKQGEQLVKDERLLITLGIDEEESIKNVEDWLDSNKEIIDEEDFLPRKDKIEGVGASIVKSFEMINDAINALPIGEKAQKEIERLDELIAKQQEVVDKTKLNAEKGNAEQLGLEEERLSRLENMRKQEESQKEQALKRALAVQRAMALAEIAINLAVTLSNIDRNSTALGALGVPLKVTQTIQAIAQAAISTASVLASTASFYDGTDDTGRGGKLDSKGGFSAILHPNERVMNAKQNKRIKSALGNVSNDDLVNMIENSKGMSIGTNGLLIDSGAINEKMGNKMDEMIQVNRQMLKAMKRNGVNVNIDKNGLSVMMHSMVKRKDIINRI